MPSERSKNEEKLNIIFLNKFIHLDTTEINCLVKFYATFTNPTIIKVSYIILFWVQGTTLKITC